MLRYWYQNKKHPDQNFKPVVLITGCASGIGLALTKTLVTHPEYRVVATARGNSLKRLHEQFTENENLLLRELDVVDEESRIQLIREIEKIWGGVDILVNNAGISYRAVVEHMTEKDEQYQMATNYFGPLGLIRLVLPHMRETGRGKIISISSVAGMLAMPTMSSYSASKFALEGASESLWYEMRPFGVSVSLVQPGFVNSNSFRNVYHSERSQPTRVWSGPYSDFYQNMAPFVERMMLSSLSTPQQVAKIILSTIKKEKPALWIPATLDARVFYFLRRILPRKIFLQFLYFCLPKARKWALAYTHKRLRHH
jgi:Short-chain dehydrogenases of various substrate specificities